MTTGKSDLRWKTAAAEGPKTKAVKKLLNKWEDISGMCLNARGVGIDLGHFNDMLHHFKHTLDGLPEDLPPERLEEIAASLPDQWVTQIKKARKIVDIFKGDLKDFDKLVTELEALK